jgi:2-(1,2-epoxy-1,2-dihydrophenyl)acetyl-CoA isomerase
MATSPTLLFDIDEKTGVAQITLNRPERLNAFNREMILAWREALDSVSRDASIRAVVVTGSGKAFCAGGDMDELESFLAMSAMERKDYLWDNVHHIALTLERIDCPVIAAINGTARGAGLDMALMCDLRIMDEQAVVAESYIAMGLMPGDGGAWFLPRLVGPAVAMELMWTSDPVDAQTALRIGMVNRVAPAGECLLQARALAQRIATQPGQAVRFTKRAIYQNMTGTSLRAHLDAASSHMAVLEDMPDFRDRVESFRNRARKKAD